MNGKDVRYELLQTLTPEDHHRYRTNAFFKYGFDQLALQIIPTFVAGLRAESDTKAARLSEEQHRRATSSAPMALDGR